MELFGHLISFLLGIVASVIATIICFYTGSRLLYFFKIRTNELRSILPFDLSKSKTITISYGYIPPVSTNSTYMVEQGDLIALLKAFTVIATVGKEKNIKIHDAISIQSSYETHANIFAISGPKWNPVTRALLGRIGSPISFTRKPDKGILIKTKSMKKGEFKDCKIDNSKLPIKCYGIILAGEVEHNSGLKQNILICCGASTLSTNACLLFLNQLSNSKFKVKQIKERGLFKQKKWGILLMVRNHKNLCNISAPLHENDVEIKVERVFYEKDFLESYTVNNYPNQI